MVLAHQDWAPRLEEIEPGAIQVRTVLTRQGGESLEQALDRACPRAPEAWRPPELDPDEPVLSFYTSGTTGKPKGVMLTHRKLTFGGPNMAQNYGLRAEDVTLAALPMVHVFCIASPFMGAFSSGGGVVVMESFKTEEALAAIARHRVTWFPGVPTMFTYLLKALDESRAYVADLTRALDENQDERVRAMCAWALGRIGGDAAARALREAAGTARGLLQEEIDLALEDLA